MPPKQPKVFISYAREDALVARRLFDDLKKAGAEPWLDVENILPGQRWEAQIDKAIKKTDFVIALLSSASLQKRGYVQKEVRSALSVLDEIPENVVYLIPARLDDCKPEDKKLRELNQVDLFPFYEIGLQKLLRVIRPEQVTQAGRLDSAYVGDDQDLAQTGWGVIFSKDSDPAVREALDPLLQRRREQAAGQDERLYREFSNDTAYQPGESGIDFLSRRGMGPGPPDPRRIPSYLLIVGGPEAIPFNFQYDLGVQYRVGRIAFEHPEQYAQYARSVLDVESGKVKNARRATFFNPTHQDDIATERALRSLTNPVYESLVRQAPSWQFEKLTGPQANKNGLSQALSEAQRTSLLFSASHGMTFGPGDARQQTDGGAILCANWPGRDATPTEEHYFSANDVNPDWDLRGLVLFLFSACSAGTPATDDFHPSRSNAPRQPLLSKLATSLLGRRDGALAVIGHVDVVYTSSFEWPGAGPQTQLFEYALQSILKGQPVASALRYFSSRYAELAAQYLQASERQPPARESFTNQLRTAMIDARNQILLGDPAARLQT